MAPEATATKKFVGLPLNVVGPVDLGRLIRELEDISNDLLQQELKKQELKMPKTSKLMDELILVNSLDLLHKSERERLEKFLAAVKEKAPVIHISFSADPSPMFTNKLMAWLRQNIHPLVMLTVGLQPNIGAGCMVRTTNKYFDFSLAQHFTKNRDLLMSKLRAPAPNEVSAATGEPTTPVATASTTTTAAATPAPAGATA